MKKIPVFKNRGVFAVPVLFALVAVIASLSFIIRQIFQIKPEEVAFRKGVEWLIRQNSIFPPETWGFGYKGIYKLTSDDKVAKELLTIIMERRKKTPLVIDEKNKKYYSLGVIEQTAKDLLEYQCSGSDITAEREKLRKIFESNKPDIEKEIPRDPTEAVILFYHLGKNGIYDNQLMDQTYSYIKQGETDSIDIIYALTHIVFAESDYFEKYPNPGDFQDEIKKFQNILAKYLKRESLSADDADMLSEVIMSLKLLNQGNNESVKEISQMLINKQNEDGSWGDPDETYGQIIHHTAVAVLALTDYRKKPRSGNDFCK